MCCCKLDSWANARVHPSNLHLYGRSPARREKADMGGGQRRGGWSRDIANSSLTSEQRGMPARWINEIELSQ